MWILHTHANRKHENANKKAYNSLQSKTFIQHNNVCALFSIINNIIVG